MDTLEYIKSKYGCSGDITYPFEVKSLDRKLLANLFAELGFTVGCEVGVRNGDNALHLLSVVPGLKMYLVDPYTMYDSSPSTTAERHQSRFKKAQEKTKNYDAVFIRKYSMEAVKDIPELSLDFVHIDGDHSSDLVMQDLLEWSKRVKAGGIVSGHDYCEGQQGEVKDAVDAYIREHNISCWFRCDVSTYFWVKGFQI